MQNKKSSGFDNISNSTIKNIGDIIAGPLSQVINRSLCDGVFPDILKIAKIVPIFKKGSTLEVGNYRPISLLPALSKIFEKVINIQLTEFMEDNNILPDTQFGFRKQKSTSNAVELLTQAIQQSKRKSEKAVAIFIDVSKAFDCCNHEIILNKLRNIGLSDRGVSLFTSYFKNRYQAVKLDNEISEKVEISMGVGQGTILGPTLFSLYLYDLPLHLNSLTIQFADDTTLYITAKTESELKSKAETQLAKLYNWMKDNGLTINESKTKMIQFLGKHLSLSLNGVQICKCGVRENEKSFNMLGILIDDKLTWKYHIDKIISKINKGRYALYKFRNILNRRSKLLIFNSLVNSHFRYGITLWGHSLGPEFKKLITTSKKCVRLLSIGHYHTDPIYRETKILKIRDLYKQEMLLQSWKYYQHKLPTAIIDNLERNNNLRDLRQQTHLLVPRLMNTKDKHQFDYNLITNINNLDAALKNIDKLTKLKRILKKSFLRTYREVVTCNLPTCRECMIVSD